MMTTHSTHPCPLCGTTRHLPHLRTGAYQIVRCSYCGFLFVSPPPTQAALTAFYQDASYYTGSQHGYADYLGERLRHEELARERLNRIERLLPGRGTLLDVGCAAGFFLHVAQQRGWQPHGVELARPMASYAETLLGVPISTTLAELGLAAGTLDAITLWEYIEHLPDPRDELVRLVGLVRPGGMLALSTPNAGYWVAIHQPAQWREFKPPAHLGFFNAASLRHLLESCGLELIHLRHTTARAPAQPYAITRLLELLRQRIGSGAERHTRWWWLFGVAWRLAEYGSRLGYQLRWPGSDLHIGLEAYALKP